MEDDLKISKVEYLSNHWLDRTQILNLNLGDQTKLYKYFKGRRSPLEEDSFFQNKNNFTKPQVKMT
jgi:hypothetical protein